jgi:PPOX class probable F420-dependent enzyme
MDLDPKARELLTAPNIGHLGFHGLDGYPKVLPVWFTLAGDEIQVATPPGAYKSRSLRADPRAVLTVSTPSAPYHVVSVSGRVTIDVLPERRRVEFVSELAVRYLGRIGGDAYLARWMKGGHPGPGDLLRILIERVRYTNVSGE